MKKNKKSGWPKKGSPSVNKHYKRIIHKVPENKHGFPEHERYFAFY